MTAANTVSRERLSPAAGDHQRDDQLDLDDGGQPPPGPGPERFSDAQGHHPGGAPQPARRRAQHYCDDQRDQGQGQSPGEGKRRRCRRAVRPSPGGDESEGLLPPWTSHSQMRQRNRRTLAECSTDSATSSGRPALKVRAIAALTLLGLLVLGAPLVLVPIVGWLVDLLR